MGVASGRSLAFVPFEFGGGRGWEREVVDGWTKGARRKNPPGVLLRPGGLVLDGRKDHPEETLISERRKHQPLAGKLFVLTT